MTTTIILFKEPPVKGCPKLMYNGPCGGGSGNICEVTRGECPWVKLYEANPGHELFNKIVLDHGFSIRDYIPKPRKPRSKLLSMINQGRKVLTYEYVTGYNADSKVILKHMQKLAGIYDALNFIDTPLGLPHTDPLALAILAKNLGIETVVQVSCKDKSRNFLVSYILALMLHDIKNMLAITGDWIHLGGDKRAKPVFDLDAVRLVYLVRLLSDLGVDYRDRKIHGGKILHVGVAVNPYFKPLDLEVKRTIRKYLAGAEFLETQPVFDVRVLNEFVKKLLQANIDIPIIPSIIYIDNSEIIPLLENFARVNVPHDYIEAVKRGRDTTIDHLARLAENILSLEHISGIHVLTMGNINVAVELGNRIRKLIS